MQIKIIINIVIDLSELKHQMYC